MSMQLEMQNDILAKYNKGLAYLVGLVKTVLVSDADVKRFQVVQRNASLNITRHVVLYILNASTSDPTLIPVANSEKLRALELIIGVCILDKKSRTIFRELRGMESLLSILDQPIPHPPPSPSPATPPVTANPPPYVLQMACIDALLSVMIDSRDNQDIFKKQQGYAKIKKFLVDGEQSKDLRLKALEFVYLTGAQFDEVANDGGVVDYNKPASGPTNQQVVSQTLGPKVTDAIFNSKHMALKSQQGRYALVHAEETLAAIDAL